MFLLVENTIVNSLVNLLILVVLCAIAWQDFKRFEVSFWLFPFGFLLFTAKDIVNIGFHGFLSQFLPNILFVLLLISTVWLYFRLRYRKPVKLTDQYIGWGDILFFFMIAPAFDIMQFVVFLTVSFATGLGYAIIQYLRTKELGKIPLAGIMAILFMFYGVYELSK